MNFNDISKARGGSGFNSNWADFFQSTKSMLASPMGLSDTIFAPMPQKPGQPQGSMAQPQQPALEQAEMPQQQGMPFRSPVMPKPPVTRSAADRFFGLPQGGVTFIPPNLAPYKGLLQGRKIGVQEETQQNQQQ